jgi:hypothetical protein
MLHLLLVMKSLVSFLIQRKIFSCIADTASLSKFKLVYYTEMSSLTYIYTNSY